MVRIMLTVFLIFIPIITVYAGSPSEKANVPQAVLPARPFAVWNHIPVNTPLIALTFDDGGSTYQVTEILDVLKDNGVKCTFFLLGNWVNNHPDLVCRILNDGHEIANHSYSHPMSSYLDADAIENEILSCQDAVYNATGKEIKPYFRPPYGDYNNMVVSTIQDLGYRAVILWDVDTRDWSGVSAQSITYKVLDEVWDGSIVLFHLHGEHTAEALRELIPALKFRGYTMTTISQMLQP